MGIAKRSLQPGAAIRAVVKAAQCQPGQGVFCNGRRQDAWQATGEQRFAGARRAKKQQVVAAAGGYFKCPACEFLPNHDIEVRILSGNGLHDRNGGLDRLVAIQVRTQGQQIRRGNNSAIGSVGGQGRTGGGHHQLAFVGGSRAGSGDDTGNWPQCAIQCQLTEKLVFAHVCRWQLIRSNQYAQRNRQVETPAFLGQVCGRQVDGDTAVRELETGVEQGAAHPILAFPYCCLGHADNVESGQAIGEMGFHPNQGCLYAGYRPAVDN